MKKSLLLIMLASVVFLFSQTLNDLQTSENQNLNTPIVEKEAKSILDEKTSMFLGIGLGAVAVDIGDKIKKAGFESYGAFSLSAQVGGITMFNQYFGLEYFYNLDLVFDTSLENTNVANKYTVFGGISNPQTTMTINNHYDIFGVLATSTINTNAILNFYNSEKLSVGIISGIGLGFDISHYAGNATLPLASIGGKIIFGDYSVNDTNVFFDVRANIGLRFAFLQDYILSLNCSIAFLDNKIVPQVATRDTASFSVRFAYLLF